MDMKTPVLSIRVVEEMTELTARQIRYYEKKELIKPSRTKGKQRLYSLEEVKILKHIKKFLELNGNLDGTKEYLTKVFPDYFDNNGPVIERPITSKPLKSLYPVDNHSALMERIKK